MYSYKLLAGCVEWPDTSQRLASDAAAPGTVARQGDRDRIIGRKSPPTCAQHQWTSCIEILSVSRRPIRPSSHPHSCSGITSILTARPYCGRCTVSACGLDAAVPADVLDPRMPPFSMHIWCRRIVSNIHRRSRPVLPQAAKCVFLFYSPSPASCCPPQELLRPLTRSSPQSLLRDPQTCITSLPEATKDRTLLVREDGRLETNTVALSSISLLYLA